MAINRPDTPLATTPEPQPVNMGQNQQAQPMPAQNKFQATADNAIAQVNMIGKMNTPPPIEQKQPDKEMPPQK